MFNWQKYFEVLLLQTLLTMKPGFLSMVNVQWLWLCRIYNSFKNKQTVYCSMLWVKAILSRDFFWRFATTLSFLGSVIFLLTWLEKCWPQTKTKNSSHDVCFLSNKFMQAGIRYNLIKRIKSSGAKNDVIGMNIFWTVQRAWTKTWTTTLKFL